MTMSEKSLDRKGRWRNKTVAFRVSPEEWDAISEAALLSGHSKQEYIIDKLLDKTVVVESSPRTYKLLKDRLESIYNELIRIQSAGECSEDFLSTIRYVADIYDRTKEAHHE